MRTLPALNWELFEQSPGASTRNWEYLCRSAVVRNFGSLGSFRAVANQPGVEFHLKINRPSDRLGDPGRWWGWQCRWYGLAPGTQIGQTRRRAIEDAIRRTEQYVPEATDWVLWTKRPLTPTDQGWFYAIETPLELHLWTADDLEDLLQGDAAILRRTYFGDLILTKENLDEAHARSIAPIRERWNPAVHVQVEAEEEIRRLLGEPEHWPELEELESDLATSKDELLAFTHQIDQDLATALTGLIEDLEDLRVRYKTIGEVLTRRDFGAVQQALDSEWVPRAGPSVGRRLARALRRRAHPSSLAVQAAIGLQLDASKFLGTFSTYLAFDLVAAVGPAGSGKTHLAAELTASRGDNLGGIYIEGWRLGARGTLNDLLPSLSGIPATSFEELLEGAEAVGMRSGVRIPIVIDGLTEAEDPASWKGELETLGVMLNNFSHVLVIVTLRPSATNVALPSSVARMELAGFGRMTGEAIHRYFEYYKIDAGSLRLPLERFRDPLFLRIFCEATNPLRQEWVGPERFPTSLAAAFTEFRNTVVQRIADRPGSIVKSYPPDILNVLDKLALSMWDTDRRAVPFGEVRELIGDTTTNWAESLARRLEDEGVLSREPDGDQRTVILFDSFAGFLIADALTKQKGKIDFAEWAREGCTATKLYGDLRGIPSGQFADRPTPADRIIGWARSLARRVIQFLPVNKNETSPVAPAIIQRAHPLAPDVRKALVGLVPRRFRMQFWELVDDDLRAEVLVDTAELEGELLDAATVEQIARLAVRPPTAGMRDLFDRLMETRDAPGHPLNARFLDGLLSELSVADRDLRWTEWVRRNETQILSATRESAEKWQADGDLEEEDHLQAVWLKWLLTSTVRHLRDHATLALYQYGRKCPDALFRLTLSGLSVNDPYVSERLLAASYGVIMAGPGESRLFDEDLTAFLDGLWSAFCGDDATSPTEHWLMREYADGIVHVSQRYYPGTLGRWPQHHEFAAPPKVTPVGLDEAGGFAADPVYGLDFKNYTVGHLIPGRHNYQFDHPGYQEVMSWIRGRVLDLGGNSESFKSADRSILSTRRGDYNRPGRVETYGKKYGWIGYFEAAGRLKEENRLPSTTDERLSDVTIDPSFPDVVEVPQITFPDLSRFPSTDARDWIAQGRVEVPDELFRIESLEGFTGSWVALSGFVEREDAETGRTVFGILRGILVRRENADRLREALENREYPGNFWIPEAPASYYVFAGEMPWSPHAREGLTGPDLRGFYGGTIEIGPGDEICVEMPSHGFSWESYHSVLNGGPQVAVPATTFAESFDLRAVPGGLNWCDPDGAPASITAFAPQGFKWGYLLYLREDLIKRYCDKHDYEIVWIIWGERQPYYADYPADRPDWLYELYANHAHIWRRVETLSRLRP